MVLSFWLALNPCAGDGRFLPFDEKIKSPSHFLQTIRFNGAFDS
jgi:hypothetical protein